MIYNNYTTIGEIAYINPPESLKKGKMAAKIGMDCVIPFCRDVPGYERCAYTGGAKFRNGDTVMARITPCLENGKTFKVTTLNDNEVGFGSTEFITFRAVKDKCDPDYLYYLIRSPYVRNASIKSMVGSSGRQRVQTDVVTSLPISVPDLKTQKRIGFFLSLLDDKILSNKRTNDNLEQQAYSLFQHMFIGNASPEWKTGTISDLGRVVGGGTPSKAKPEFYIANGIAWITPKDLSNDKSKFIAHGETDITIDGLQNSSATLMPKGSVLFSSRAPIGYIAIADGEVSTNQGFKSIVPNKNIGTAYIYYFLKHNLAMIESRASGSTFKEVSGSIMKSIPACIPDQQALTNFSRLCEPLFSQQECLEKQNRILATQRDILLPRLMSGEIDVSEVEI